MHCTIRSMAAGVALIAFGMLSPVAAGAETARAIGPTPPRLALAEGEVSFWRPGAEGWAPAARNTALAAGDALYVADGALEIELTSGAFVRAGAETELRIESLELGYLQLSVLSGQVAVDVPELPEGQVVEVAAPHGALMIERPGYYRIDVDERSSFVAHRGGGATVVLADGEEIDFREGERVTVKDAERARVDAAPPIDDWDRWNWDRTEGAAAAARGARYVPPAIAGVRDLDHYGDWSETSQYGAVWVPRQVAADWAPYTTGRWVWDPHYGWTWVDDAPWGWAPYHYGRWCWLDGHWGWAPGPVVARPVYAPALVGFLGSHGGGVSVSVGVSVPLVSWVALGYGEPILPWWGPPGFVGRPFWGGWDGPRYVNGAVIRHRHIVDVKHIRRFRNVRVRHAVVAADRRHFGRGRFDRIRLDDDRARKLDIVRGRLGVKPVAASLGPRHERARGPRDRDRARHVVATRRPQDVARRLRNAGLEPRERGPRVEPRIVARRGDDERGRGRLRDGSPSGDERRGVRAGGPGRDRDGRSGREGRGAGVEAGRRGVPAPPSRGEGVDPGDRRRDRPDGTIENRRGGDDRPGARNAPERDRVRDGDPDNRPPRERDVEAGLRREGGRDVEEIPRRERDRDVESAPRRERGGEIERRPPRERSPRAESQGNDERRDVPPPAPRGERIEPRDRQPERAPRAREVEKRARQDVPAPPSRRERVERRDRPPAPAPRSRDVERRARENAPAPPPSRGEVIERRDRPPERDRRAPDVDRRTRRDDAPLSGGGRVERRDRQPERPRVQDVEKSKRREAPRPREQRAAREAPRQPRQPRREPRQPSVQRQERRQQERREVEARAPREPAGRDGDGRQARPQRGEDKPERPGGKNRR